MILGLSYLQFVGLMAGAILVVGLVVFAAIRHVSKTVDEEVEEAVALADGGEGAGEVATLDAPNVKNSILGLLSQWRHRAKASKMAAKGYVKWMKLRDSATDVQWVKPEFRGMGVAEYYDSDDDVTYLFPKRAMAIDGETGAWLAIHRANEADPVNLADPISPAIPADQLQSVIDSAQQMEKPSFFDRLDLSMGQMMVVVTVVLFIIYAATTVMGGGL